MTEDIIITSRRNPRVVDARKLTQRKHRTRQGRFLVEGEQLLWMALDSGWTIDEVFTPDTPGDTSSSLSTLLVRLASQGTTILQVAPDILATLSTRGDTSNPIGAVKQAATSLADIALPDLALVLVLDRLQDCGNVGTLVRTADAAGATVVVLLEPCADIYDPHAVRGSMGSLFNVPVVSVGDVPSLTSWLCAHNLPMVGADAHTGVLWGNEALRGSLALCMGNEARGLSPDLAEGIDAWVRLPIRGKADSLNVAIAGGILMYRWLAINSVER